MSIIENKILGTDSSFRSYQETITHDSVRAPEFIDITEEVAEAVRRADIGHGMAVVFSQHTTAAIKINESEPELIKDMTRFLEEIAPSERDYHHNNFDVRTVNMEEDECPNAHSHCQHLILSASETVPVLNGRLALGRWQRIFLVELDRAKTRRVTVQVLGV